MRRKHGVWSLILILLAITLGVISIAQSSKFMALMYVIISLISLMIIVYSFCSKCPCRQQACGHVVLGKLTKLLPGRPEGPYTKADYFGVLVPLLFMFGMPQVWLIGRLQFMVVFWALLIIAAIEITFKVCKGCGNKSCPVNSRLN